MIETKKNLAIIIRDIIKEKKCTQREVAQKIEIDQPRVCNLLSGNLYSFSLERLLNILNLLGWDVVIRITPGLDKGKTMLKKLNIVAQDKIGDYFISTVWIGKPGLEGTCFETLVTQLPKRGVDPRKGGDLGEEIEIHHYGSLNEAEKGHKAVVKRLSKTITS